jgi:hypothetical protein
MARVTCAASLVVAVTLFPGCATLESSGLSRIESSQRHELYRRCIDTRMKQAAFGTGMEVHENCLRWARNQV